MASILDQVLSTNSFSKEIIDNYLRLQVSTAIQSDIIILSQESKMCNQGKCRCQERPSICECHCGTRIDLDEQLLQEREFWKEKYKCLQKQMNTEIGKLKQNIYAECSNLMQEEFTTREAAHNAQINQKNQEIKNLTAKIINLESKIKVLQKEKEIEEQNLSEYEAEIQRKNHQIGLLKGQSNKDNNDWETRLQNQKQHLRKKLLGSSNEELRKLQDENQCLRSKISEYDKKFQQLIPEVQKMKSALSSKTQQIEVLENRYERYSRECQNQINILRNQRNQLDQAIKNYRLQIVKLETALRKAEDQVNKVSGLKKEVRVEPVYIDRPVEVQKVIQKIIEVEKVVKQYIEPEDTGNPELQHQIKKLRAQLNNVLLELQSMEDRYKMTTQEYEQCVKGLETNIQKYKKEREQLVKNIQELHKELDLYQNFADQNRGCRCHGHDKDNEKIIVHVNKDGTYKQTIEKPTNESRRSGVGKAMTKTTTKTGKK